MQLLGAEATADKFGRMGKYAPGALKNAVRKAATLQSRAIKANIKRSRTGLMAKSIGSKVSEKRPGRVTGLAGPRKGFRTVITAATPKKLTGQRDAKGGDKKIVLKAAAGVSQGDTISATRYAHLAEDDHKHMPGGGRTKGQGFMRRAFSQTKEPATAIVRQEMAKIKEA